MLAIAIASCSQMLFNKMQIFLRIPNTCVDVVQIWKDAILEIVNSIIALKMGQPYRRRGKPGNEDVDKFERLVHAYLSRDKWFRAIIGWAEWRNRKMGRREYRAVKTIE